MILVQTAFEGSVRGCDNILAKKISQKFVSCKFSFHFLWFQSFPSKPASRVYVCVPFKMMKSAMQQEITQDYWIEDAALL